MKLSWCEVEELRTTHNALGKISGGKRKQVKLREFATKIGFSKGKVLKWLRVLQEIDKIGEIDRFGEMLFVRVEDNSLVTSDSLLKSSRFILLSLDDPIEKRLETLTEENKNLTSTIRKRESEIANLQREIESLKTTGKTLSERLRDNLVVNGD